MWQNRYELVVRMDPNKEMRVVIFYPFDCAAMFIGSTSHYQQKALLVEYAIKQDIAYLVAGLGFTPSKC